MALMYDTIMELPLFKGIGEEQLSLMLEKTSVEFLNFKDGDLIAEESSMVSNVDFIISGRVKNIYKLENFPIEIHETLGKGGVLGALRLYGLQTNYDARSYALGDVSLLRIGKAQYMNILLSDKIYVLNFVNYLSAAAQKGPAMMMSASAPSVAQTLKTLAYSVASKRAEEVKVVGSDSALAQYCAVSEDEIRRYRNSK